MVEGAHKDEYPWYSDADGTETLQQGDLIMDCPMIKPSSTAESGDSIDASYIEQDVVIMTQSCDIENDKTKLLMVCPYFNAHENVKGKDKRTKLLKGNILGMHLLNRFSEKDDFIVVDFKSAFSIQKDVIKEIAKRQGSRKRLNPPYRERLSQAFARFFMRVGLPQDIQGFLESSK